MSITIGFDTATQATVVAAVSDGEVLHEEEIRAGSEGRPPHASALLPAIERAVGEAGGWEAVSRIVTGVGPGSYTGLRIGIATARALAQALGKPVAPVCTLTALARRMSHEDATEARPMLPVIDARRSQVFTALYAASGEEFWPPLVTGPAELAERLRALDYPPLAAGDGAIRFAEELSAAGALVPARDEAVHRLRGRDVCEAGEPIDSVSPDRIQPIYLRAPDAERWLARDTG